MPRLVKKPTKRIRTLCKKFKVKLTVKHGSKKVYKSKRVLMKQLRKKMKSRKSSKRRSSFGKKRRSGFGVLKKDCGCSGFGKKRRSGFGILKKDCGCSGFGNKRRSGFGLKRSSDVKKLHRLCKVYHIKIGKKSPKLLRKQCLKKAIKLYKQQKRK
jgi:hypothetical protein